MKVLILIFFSFLLISTASAGLEEIFGNAEIGDQCGSDYQCQTLCCKGNNGGSLTCAEHNSQQSCSKPAGETCISNEFCKSEYVTVCKVVRTGVGADGSPMCVLRCPPNLVKGSCVNNTCRPPIAPPVPSFDPKDCSNAVDP